MSSWSVIYNQSLSAPFFFFSWFIVLFLPFFLKVGCCYLVVMIGKREVTLPISNTIIIFSDSKKKPITNVQTDKGHWGKIR
jgi:hypothetical protein